MISVKTTESVKRFNGDRTMEGTRVSIEFGKPVGNVVRVLIEGRSYDLEDLLLWDFCTTLYINRESYEVVRANGIPLGKMGSVFAIKDGCNVDESYNFAEVLYYSWSVPLIDANEISVVVLGAITDQIFDLVDDSEESDDASEESTAERVVLIEDANPERVEEPFSLYEAQLALRHRSHDALEEAKRCLRCQLRLTISKVPMPPS